MKKLISAILATAVLATPVSAKANAGDVVVGIILGVTGYAILDRADRQDRYDRRYRHDHRDRYDRYRRDYDTRGYYVNPGRPKSEDRCVFVESRDYYGDPTIIQVC